MWNEKMKRWDGERGARAEARKQVLSFILVLAMVFGSLGLTGWGTDEAYAAGGAGSSTYTIEDDTNAATVRIEGNGFGADGTNTGIGTVMANTMVDLGTLSSGYKAIDVVNAALASRELPAAVGSGGFYTAFGGVSGVSGKNWIFMLNDEAASGLGSQEISSGDDIVLMLTGSSPAPDYFNTTDYAYFRIVNSEHNDVIDLGAYGKFPYGEVTLKLLSKTQIGTDDLWNPVWNVTPVGSTDIYTNGEQAYTPADAEAVTDYSSGTVAITLWGGTSAGTYYFDITATVDGATSAYCRAKMVYDGTNPPALTFSVPSAVDTTLDTLTLTFPGGAAISGLPYVGAGGMSVSNSIESVSLAASENDVSATIEATYKDADDEYSSSYTLGDSVNLAVGANTFRLVVTNGEESQTHTLIITRQPAGVRNIPNEVAAVINGVKAVTGDAPYTDWILAMNAAGLTPTASEKATYLAGVLTVVDNFADSGTGNPATMAKIAIALTSLGIDARQIPDPDGGAAIDLVRAAAEAFDVVRYSPVYGAPYLLSLYDLGNYEIPAGAAYTRLELINAILAAEADWTDWGVDGIGMVLPALAPYYNASAAVNGIELAKCQEVTAAVDRALVIASGAQTIDGGFGAPNSNTVSTVITGLNAIDIDSNSDSDFIKGGTSLLMNLLSFRTSDDKLGYDNSASADPMACVQGFQALATWQNLSNSRSSNLYHFTKQTAPYTSWPDAELLTGIAVTTLPAIVTYDIGSADTVPDTAGIGITATYNADSSNKRIVDIADCTVSHIDCRTAGTKEVTVGYQGQTATFMVTVRTAGGGLPDQDTVSVRVKNNSGTVASDNAVVIEKGKTTALDVLKTVLNNAGIGYVIQGDYVKEIGGLGEFAQGANSGWMYSVNGTTPEVTSASDYELAGGDVVLWYYTLDYTKDPSTISWKANHPETAGGSEGIAKVELTAKVNAAGKATAAVTDKEMAAAIASANDSAKSAGSGTLVEVRLEVKGADGAKTVETTIPGDSIKQLKNGADAMTVDTPVAEIRLDAGVIGTLAGETGKDIKITASKRSADELDNLSEEAKKEIGDKPVFEFSITAGTKTISELGGNAAITVPYTATPEESAEGLVIYYINSSGELEIIRDCVYDPATKTMTFNTGHFSQYALGYRALNFTDIGSHWAKNHIIFLAAREAISGMTAATFAPDANITRAQFIQILANLSGAGMENAGGGSQGSGRTGSQGSDQSGVNGPAGPFHDVPAAAWYAEAAAWAAEKGIVTGSEDQDGNIAFRPNEAISRQDMCAMLARYVDQTGYRSLTAEKEKKIFQDDVRIAGYAKEAVARLQQAGLIDGKTPETFAPNGFTTRAESAKVISMLMKMKN
jgi:hypothetical protein